jgi:hypothetical protein
MALAVLASAAFTLMLGGPVMAVEEAPYRVISNAGGLEIREYPPLVVAEVTVEGDRESAVNTGFRQLAAYIFGGNHRKGTIAMTAPVTQRKTRGESLAMTAPVTQTPDGQSWVIQFVMPRGSTLETLPQPDDARVRLNVSPSERRAVVRFSGLTGSKHVEKETGALDALLLAGGYQSHGAVSLARFDPPWTPWFMRHNEVSRAIGAE